LLERSELRSHLIQLLLRLLELRLRSFHCGRQLLDLRRNARLRRLRREPEHGCPEQYREDGDWLQEKMRLSREMLAAIRTKRFHGR
jgi:hypothetical protein